MADQQSERAPLLPQQAHETSPAASGDPRPIWFATTTSVAAGLLTLIFLVASMVLMSSAPSQYYPPYELYYSFAPIAGFVSAV
jgi:hypothetical protein